MINFESVYNMIHCFLSNELKNIFMSDCLKCTPNNSTDSHRKSFKLLLKIMSCIGIIFSFSQSLASKLTITPASFSVLPKSILHGQTATAYYIIKNNTSSYQKNIHVQYLPKNAVQVVSGSTYGSCGLVFDLAAKGATKKNPSDPSDWCYLQLKISGEIDSNDPNHKHHLTLCQGVSDCSIVDLKENELNIMAGIPNDLARLSIVLEHTETKQDSINSIAYVSDDGGIGWKSSRIFGAVGYIRSISCDKNGGLFCIAVGDAYNKGTNGGKTTFLAYTSNDGGISWAKHILGVHGGSSGLRDVTCSGAQWEYCVAVGGYQPVTNNARSAPIVYTSSDRGENWIPNYPKIINNTTDTIMNAVSCSGNIGQYCTVVGLSYTGWDSESHNNTTTFISYTSNDSGSTWSPHILNKHIGISQLNSIKCTNNDGQSCIAVGYLNKGPNTTKPIIYSSFDGGNNWTYAEPIEGLGGGLNEITCDSNNQNCFAAGFYWTRSGKNFYHSFPIIYNSQNGGLSWNKTKFTNYANSSFKSISCSKGEKYCTAIGTTHSSNKNIPLIYYSFDAGNSWLSRFALGFSNAGDTARSIESVGILLSTNAQ